MGIAEARCSPQRRFEPAFHFRPDARDEVDQRASSRRRPCEKILTSSLWSALPKWEDLYLAVDGGWYCSEIHPVLERSPFAGAFHYAEPVGSGVSRAAPGARRVLLACPFAGYLGGCGARPRQSR